MGDREEGDSVPRRRSTMFIRRMRTDSIMYDISLDFFKRFSSIYLVVVETS